MFDLKAAIKAANTTQEKWAYTQSIDKATASRLVTRGCIVDEKGKVYSPTKYTVKPSN